MERNNFRHYHRLRVRPAEVDGTQLTRGAHFLMYFDLALESYWRSLGLIDTEPLQRWEGKVATRHVQIDFLKPAHLGDILDIGLSCVEQGESSLVFQGAAFLGNVLLASVRSVQVFLQSGLPTGTTVPTALRDLIQAHEDGQPMVSLVTGSWSELQAQAIAVRRAVFIEEQSIPAELELDEADNSAVHAVVVNRLGQGLATGRLLDSERAAFSAVKDAYIGRMAVMPMLRGVGLGRQVLLALIAQAQTKGAQVARLNAQLSAVGFYRRAGFMAEGEPFHEANIPHQSMILPLS